MLLRSLLFVETRYDIYRKYLRERGTREYEGDDDDEEYCLYIVKRAKIVRNVARFRESFTGGVKRFR